MMKYFLFILFSTYTFLVSAQPLKPIDTGSEISFLINNFGLATKGSLSELSGSINWSPQNLSASNFNVSVASRSINTSNSLRDNHLKKADYFDVEKYPAINFQSNQIIAGNKPGEFSMEGTLTIKGISKKINFRFNAITQNGKTIFEGSFEINRRDFKIGGGSISLSNTVKISLKIIAY